MHSSRFFFLHFFNLSLDFSALVGITKLVDRSIECDYNMVQKDTKQVFNMFKETIYRHGMVGRPIHLARSILDSPGDIKAQGNRGFTAVRDFSKTSRGNKPSGSAPQR